jgi:hypothetical protein
MVKNLCMENSVIKLHLLSTVYYRKGWRKSQAFLSLKKKGRVFCRKRSFRPIFAHSGGSPHPVFARIIPSSLQLSLLPPWKRGLRRGSPAGL